jgi:hypothetical protein
MRPHQIKLDVRQRQMSCSLPMPRSCIGAVGSRKTFNVQKVEQRDAINSPCREIPPFPPQSTYGTRANREPRISLMISGQRFPSCCQSRHTCVPMMDTLLSGLVRPIQARGQYPGHPHQDSVRAEIWSNAARWHTLSDCCYSCDLQSY